MNETKQLEIKKEEAPVQEEDPEITIIEEAPTLKKEEPRPKKAKPRARRGRRTLEQILGGDDVSKEEKINAIETELDNVRAQMSFVVQKQIHDSKLPQSVENFDSVAESEASAYMIKDLKSDYEKAQQRLKYMSDKLEQLQKLVDGLNGDDETSLRSEIKKRDEKIEGMERNLQAMQATINDDIKKSLAVHYEKIRDLHTIKAHKPNPLRDFRGRSLQHKISVRPTTDPSVNISNTADKIKASLMKKLKLTG